MNVSLELDMMRALSPLAVNSPAAQKPVDKTPQTTDKISYDSFLLDVLYL